MSTIGITYDEVIEIANRVSDNVKNYFTSLENVYKKLEEAEEMWKGVDNNAFTEKVIENKEQLVKIGNDVEAHAQYLRNTAVKTSNLQDNIVDAAGRLL